MSSGNKTNRYVKTIEELLIPMTKNKYSDLHLVEGVPPSYRVDSDLMETELPPLTSSDIKGMMDDVLTDAEWNKFQEKLELDFSHSIKGVARYRGNAMKQRGSYALVFRAVPYDVPEFSTLGLPDEVKKMSKLKRGLVLVTGPTGSGKSTTLASIIDLINRERKLNIVTIEDPIEYLHRHKKSYIRQREIGIDTHSFSDALKHVLRHDPDVIFVGEMRDLESIKIALTAAETGHLVFSTLHTQTAPLTINRVIDVFGETERAQVRKQFASTIQAIVYQQLLPKIGGGIIVAAEILRGVAAIRNLIREGKEHQVYSVMQMGQEYGMNTMDSALIELYRTGKITKGTLYEYCVDKQEIDRVLEKKTKFATSGLERW